MGGMEKLNAEEMAPAVFAEMQKFKQEQLKRLQGEIFAEENRLADLKRQQEESAKQARYDQQVERTKFEDGLHLQAEKLQEERKSLERLDLEVESRRKEVEVLEEQAIPTRQALQKLSDERIAIEQQRLRNEELRIENDRMATATSVAHEEVSQLKASLLAANEKVQRQITDQDVQQRQLDALAQSTALQVENLTALKETIDPKLVEVTKLQVQADADKQQAQVLRDEVVSRQAEMEKQKSDLAILSSQLEAKASALTEYDAALKRTDAELRIKIQQAGIESVIMPEAPQET